MQQTTLFFLIISCGLCFTQNVKEYVKKHKEVAINEMHIYSIPASITLAQAILESGSGTSKLALESNNHFGIKCHVGWDGMKTYHDDDAKQECFRKYNNVNESFRDHSVFLSERSRYSFLFELNKKDYRGWAKGLQKAGYATNKLYAKKLINIIKEYNLAQYDNKRLSKKQREELFADNRRSNSAIYEENYIKYVLAEKGQYYDDIAEEQDVWLWQLLKYNESDIDRVLVEGEKVYLQPKRRKSSHSYHVVQQGETMYSVSQLYGIKIKYLYKKNRMNVGSEPYVGQKLSLKNKLKFN